MNLLYALALAGVIGLALPGGSEAKRAPVVAGDSHCAGLALATGLTSYARVGAHTREVVAQLRNIPPGATVIVCAGTNDAAARLQGFAQSVERVLAEAKKRRQYLIWVGPIGTSLWWEAYSDHADTLLALRIPKYVSLRAVRWRPSERAHDRIHLTAKGSMRLWRIVEEKLQ
jgi:lysophospholipase L1-like esterase